MTNPAEQPQNTTVTDRAPAELQYGDGMVPDLPHASQKVRVRMVLGAAQLVGAVMFVLPLAFAVTYQGVAPHAAALAGASLLLVATALAANVGERHKLNLALVIGGAAGLALLAAAPATLAALVSDAATDTAMMLVWVAAIGAGASLLIRFIYTVCRVAGFAAPANGHGAMHTAATEFAAYFPFARPLYNQGFAGFARRQAHKLEESAEQLPNRV